MRYQIDTNIPSYEVFVEPPTNFNYQACSDYMSNMRLKLSVRTDGWVNVGLAYVDLLLSYLDSTLEQD